MRLYRVFDCTTALGYSVRAVPTAWLALLVCRVLTALTGRFHDYAEGKA